MIGRSEDHGNRGERRLRAVRDDGDHATATHAFRVRRVIAGKASRRKKLFVVPARRLWLVPPLERD
jgi:hypothetical protein